FYDDSAEFFNVYFYEWYLESLRNPEMPERRLLELHRSLEPIPIAFNRLRASGALVPMPDHDSHPLRVSDEVLAHENTIDEFCDKWEDCCRSDELGEAVWLAALIGDWLAADEMAEGQPEIQQITGPRAEKCREIRRKQLLQETGSTASNALYGLAELGGAD